MNTPTIELQNKLRRCRDEYFKISEAFGKLLKIDPSLWAEIGGSKTLQTLEYITRPDPSPPYPGCVSNPDTGSWRDRDQSKPRAWCDQPDHVIVRYGNHEHGYTTAEAADLLADLRDAIQRSL